MKVNLNNDAIIEVQDQFHAFEIMNGYLQREARAGERVKWYRLGEVPYDNLAYLIDEEGNERRFTKIIEN